jgi:hypothetical protein
MDLIDERRARALRRGDPDLLGPYVLLGRLGAGGMGVVYLARGPQGGLVAVKMVHRELARDEEFRERFRSEVDRIRQVPPFCTAEILDADLEHDPPYLVIEYVDGPSLHDDVCDNGPLSPANVHAVALGVASALTAIHSAGVVHRDLKPQNVLLAPGSPKVIDFGLARALETRAPDPYTAPGITVGTLDYMSPERLDGTADGGSAAADIFAWGVVVAYAATGRVPFRGVTSQQIAASILAGEPDLAGVPAGLQEPVRQALEKNPADRPTARELLDELLSSSSGQTPIRPTRHRRRRKAPVLIAASLVLIAMLAVAVAAIRPGRLLAAAVSPGQPAVSATAIGGTTILDVTDPVGDDNGPGSYRYPSADEFRAGSFDLTRFRVVDEGTLVTLEVSIRDLTPAFGPALGAQLLDVFIRDPQAGAFSTDPPHPLRNFRIAKSSAWSSRIEVQGFASPVFVDARGRRMGSVSVLADEKLKTVRIGVQKAALGTPAHGWVFTIALHGQEGFSQDQARSFARAPQAYQFGVCELDATARICDTAPTKVAKVMDVIPPADVLQSEELDPTPGRVTLHGITVR